MPFCAFLAFFGQFCTFVEYVFQQTPTTPLSQFLRNSLRLFESPQRLKIIKRSSKSQRAWPGRSHEGSLFRHLTAHCHNFCVHCLIWSKLLVAHLHAVYFNKLLLDRRSDWYQSWWACSQRLNDEKLLKGLTWVKGRGQAGDMNSNEFQTLPLNCKLL